MFIFIATLLVAKGSLPILLAAAAAGAAPPDLTGIAAIITALVGVIAFLVTLFRGHDVTDEVEQAASYVAGFDALIKRLEEEIDEIHAEQRGERQHYAEEKERMLDTIRSLRAELSESLSAHAVTKGELAELKGQVKGFLDPQLYREFMRHLTKKS